MIITDYFLLPYFVNVQSILHFLFRIYNKCSILYLFLSFILLYVPVLFVVVAVTVVALLYLPTSFYKLYTGGSGEH